VASLKRIFRAVAVIALVTAQSMAAAAQQNVRLLEQDIKAGLLYNFLRYTDWPTIARDDQPVVVCVYGGDPFEGRLTPMTGRTVNRRAIEVRNVAGESDVNACSLLYVNAQRRDDWPQLRSRLARRSILTVSDYEGFARSGGMIEFTRTNNRIGVQINVGAARAVDLSVQDRLLRLASVVRTDSR
jgi:hypothetical protein